MIESYAFGSIKISGETYKEDVEVDWQDKVIPWKRSQSHIIDVASVQKALIKFPEIIVIGTGKSGIAQVLEETKQEVEKRGVELIIEETPQAVGTFNNLKDQNKKVIGLFHLTC